MLNIEDFIKYFNLDYLHKDCTIKIIQFIFTNKLEYTNLVTCYFQLLDYNFTHQQDEKNVLLEQFMGNLDQVKQLTESSLLTNPIPFLNMHFLSPKPHDYIKNIKSKGLFYQLYPWRKFIMKTENLWSKNEHLWLKLQKNSPVKNIPIPLEIKFLVYRLQKIYEFSPQVYLLAHFYLQLNGSENLFFHFLCILWFMCHQKKRVMFSVLMMLELLPRIHIRKKTNEQIIDQLAQYKFRLQDPSFTKFTKNSQVYLDELNQLPFKFHLPLSYYYPIFEKYQIGLLNTSNYVESVLDLLSQLFPLEIFTLPRAYFLNKYDYMMIYKFLYGHYLTDEMKVYVSQVLLHPLTNNTKYFNYWQTLFF